MRRARKRDGGGGNDWFKGETIDALIERIYYQDLGGVATMGDVAKRVQRELDDATLDGFELDGIRRRCRRVVGRRDARGMPRAAAIEPGDDPRWAQRSLWTFQNYDFVLNDREGQVSGASTVNYRLRRECREAFGREPEIRDPALRAYYAVKDETPDDDNSGGNPEGFMPEPDEED